MTEKDSLNKIIDVLGILLGATITAAYAISVYNVEVQGKIAVEAGLAIAVLAIPAIAIFIIYVKYLKILKKQPEETLNVKLDINLNDDIVLKKDEKFTLILEKDDTGNLIIKKR